MTAMYLIFLLFTVSMASLQPQRSPRNKRDLLELGGIIKCVTGRSALSYTMYGCYCGIGGQGWPKDQADWCCYEHDWCFGNAESEGCSPKMDHYDWKCKGNQALCDARNDRCAKIICQCDTALASCLKTAPYNPGYVDWPKSHC